MGRRKEGGDNRQKAGGRRQWAVGRRREAGGKREGFIGRRQEGGGRRKKVLVEGYDPLKLALHYLKFKIQHLK